MSRSCQALRALLFPHYLNFSFCGGYFFKLTCLFLGIVPREIKFHSQKWKQLGVWGSLSHEFLHAHFSWLKLLVTPLLGLSESSWHLLSKQTNSLFTVLSIVLHCTQSTRENWGYSAPISIRAVGTNTMQLRLQTPSLQKVHTSCLISFPFYRSLG